MTYGARTRTAAWFVAALMTLGACEDQVIYRIGADGGPPSAGGSGVGIGGSDMSSGVGANGGSSGSGSEAGGNPVGGAGGGGGNEMCIAGTESVQVMFRRWDGSIFGCGVTPPTDISDTFQGTVIDTDGVSEITIDECQVEPCPQELSTLTVTAPNLTFMAPVGHLVAVELSVVNGLQCVQQVQVTDLGPDMTLWLAAADGTIETFVDSVFDISKVGTGCGSGGIDPYALQFFLASDNAQMIEVVQGQTLPWTVDLPANEVLLQVRDLRSYENGNPKDKTNWAYWITPAGVQPD